MDRDGCLWLDEPDHFNALPRVHRHHHDAEEHRAAEVQERQVDVGEPAGDLLQLVEQATDNLPEVFRLVFVTRVIEGMSVEETSELLGIKPETVKTRLHRARQLVRDQLDKQIGPVLMDAFPFAGRRCDRMTEAVMIRLGFR